MKRVLFPLICFLCMHVQAQTKKLASLPGALSEVSGIAFYNDSLLVAHNDGGNEPILYFLRTDGTLVHSVRIENAVNTDWEDVTTDGRGRIFIGDIGNNGNARKDLAIYIVSDPEILQKERVNAQRISFFYPEQTAFPPADTALYYDAEALAWQHGKLYIFTKCRRKPYNGLSLVYELPDEEGSCSAKLTDTLQHGGKNWLASFTAAEIHNDTLYVLSYTHVFLFEIRKNKLIFTRKEAVGSISQKEGLAVSAGGRIYLADEERPLLGGRNLYLFTWKKD